MVVSLAATMATTGITQDIEARPVFELAGSPIHPVQVDDGGTGSSLTSFGLAMDYAIQLNGTVVAEANNRQQAIEIADACSGASVVSETTGSAVWTDLNSSPQQGPSAVGQTASGGGSDGNSTPSTDGPQQSGPTTTESGTMLPPTVYYSVKNNLVYKTLAGGYSYVVGPAPTFMTSGQMYIAKGTQFYLWNHNGTATAVGTYESPYRTLDLTLNSPMTAAQMATFIQANDASSPLLALVPVYLQAQQMYGVDAAYLLAHSVIESAWGTSQIAHDKHNLFGYSAFDNSPYSSATTFPSMAYAILYEAWFVRESYLNSSGQFYNGPNLDGMNVDYATDPNWAESIAAVMWSMDPFNAVDYQSKASLPQATTEPVFGYPSGVLGTITGSGVNIRSQPTLQSTIYEHLDNNAAIQIVGWLPGWYELALSDKRVAYVSSKYAKPTNLGKVIADLVQVRLGPTTSTPSLRTLSYGDPVVILGLSPDGQWTQVKLMDGTQGYIFTKYIANLT